MGLMDRDYMHEKHRSQATTNRYLHPNLKSLTFRRSYKNLVSAAIYVLIGVLLVLSYLQAPTVATANKKLKCTLEAFKFDTNGDGFFSIKDIGCWRRSNIDPWGTILNRRQQSQAQVWFKKYL